MRLIGTVIAAAALAACTSADGSTPAPPGPVAILGDSIAFESAAEIDDALAPTPVRNESAIGRRMDQAVRDARAIVDDGYETVTVILGTNDAHRGVTEQDLREITWIGAVLRPVRCVQWVPVATDTGDPALERGEAAINDALSTMRDIDLVSWSPDPSWLRPDGIHLNDAGQRALARTIRTALEAC